MYSSGAGSALTTSGGSAALMDRPDEDEMATEFSPYFLHHEPGGAVFDVFLSFTRATPGSIDQVESIRKALAGRGLKVFMDTGIDEFAGITSSLLRALAGSTVLLAHYSRQYPTRYACQWELTAAFLAAQRLGHPCDRVLAINTEGPERTDHLMPIELADARFFDALQTSADYERLAARVESVVRHASGPLGAAPPSDTSTLPEQVQKPRRFVGRYRELWSLHSGLRSMDFTGVSRPGSRPAVWVSGLVGIGKTTLVAQYAFLFRDAYPGGVFWIGPLGGRARHGDAAGVLAQYADELRDIAGDLLGPAALGVPPDRLAATVARHLDREGRRTLWIVEDMPTGLPNPVLERLLVPSDNARTVLTSAVPAPDWDATPLELAGLDHEDALLLFSEVLPLSTRAERDAVRALVDRCGGHPTVLRAVAHAARVRRGLDPQGGLDAYVSAASADVVNAVRDDLRVLEPDAMTILTTASVLAPGPFPPELVLGAAAEADPRRRIGAAADRLVEAGLLRPVGAEWQVSPTVVEAVRAATPAAVLTDEARRVAEELLGMLAAPEAGSPRLVAHSQRLGERLDVPKDVRLALLRRIGAYHEARGNPGAAAAALDALLELSRCSVTDLLAAARAHLACGKYVHADELAESALVLADATDDHRARYRAGLVAAQALDRSGRYAQADATFWRTAMTDEPPSWLDPVERFAARLAAVTAMRLRGDLRAAAAKAEALVAEVRSEQAGDVGLAARLELARLLQLTGNARRARELAGDVLAHYRNANMLGHPYLAEAELVSADAWLTLDLIDRDSKEKNWRESERNLRRLADDYADRLGPDNALALAARVAADRALISLGQPDRAFTALAETERLIKQHLGDDHPLLFRTRHAVGLGHGQRKEYPREAEILQKLVDAQTATLGGKHPDTIESTLDLGVALAMTGDTARARLLVDHAAQALPGSVGPLTELSVRARVAQGIVRLPHWALVAFDRVDKYHRQRKGSVS